jgi:hypothetical protein
MTLTTYQKKARETDIRQQTASVNLRLVCSVLGLIEEIEEYKENPSVSEAGDIMWYIASICTELGINLVEVQTRPDYSTVISVAKLLKKTLRDHDGCMPVQYKQDMLTYLRRVYRSIPEDSIPQVLEHNIFKLQDRLQRNVISGDGDSR